MFLIYKTSIMKPSLKYLVLLSGVIAVLYSCRPDTYKTLAAPGNYIQSLAGTWKLSKVLQTDEDAKRKGFPFQSQDITNVFAYTDFTMTLNTNGTTPTSFVIVRGNAPNIIPIASGNWKVDDPKFPNVLTLSNGTDSSKITLGAYPVQQTPLLKLSAHKKDASTGKLLISYSYEFTKK
jgi:hypothetical protein